MPIKRKAKFEYEEQKTNYLKKYLSDNKAFLRRSLSYATLNDTKNDNNVNHDDLKSILTRRPINNTSPLTCDSQFKLKFKNLRKNSEFVLFLNYSCTS
jgi:hypothetical protein